jgi:hypothetical protein
MNLKQSCTQQRSSSAKSVWWCLLVCGWGCS